MHDKPLVSVIIVSCDRPDFLPRAIKSVFDQDYRPIELILIDNLSTTPISATPAPQGVEFKLHRTERFMNASESRNVGIDMATGAYVSFLDDDDFYLPGKITAQVEALRAQPDADFAIIDYKSIEADGSDRICGLHDLSCTESLMRWVPVHTSSLFVPLEIARNEKFNEALDKFTDLHVTFRLFERYTPVKAEGVGSVFNRSNRPDQITNTTIWRKITGVGRNYRNWKIICDDFAHLIDPSPLLRREYYGRQFKYSAATGHVADAVHYGLAAIGKRDNLKADA